MTNHERTFGQPQDGTGQGVTHTAPAGNYSSTQTKPDSENERDLGQRASEVADQARETVDSQRERASHGLDSAADQLREHADQIPGGQRTSDIANQAAERVEGIAEYIQENDMSAMLSDVEQLVRDHPKESLIAAAVVGFVVARAIRS